MLRIIDLEIEESITGDTGVFEIAFVEYPAIEQEMIYFSKDTIQRFESYNDYPKEASENACKVLRWIDEHGRDEVSGMESTGLQRANQLCKGEPISEETIARMSSFERHRKNSEIDPEFEGTPWKDKGYVAWLAWGGDAGVEWASKKLQRIREELAEVGERGGIKASPKAPKSDTPNKNPRGENTAKGKASGKRGAEVTASQEKTLQGKVDDFNEKESNTKNGRATLGALKSVFQRGLGAYNTSHSPAVRSSEQWAYARVNAFLYLLKNGRPENKKYVTDNDLLPNDHPKAEKMSQLQDFVKPDSGENEKDFIGRCMGDSQMTSEYPGEDQRTAVCYSYWERKDEFSRNQVSFDWSVLETQYGRDMFENEMRRGSIPFIFVQGSSPKELIEFTNKYRIPGTNIQNYSTRLQKIDLINKMDLDRHYDDDFYVRKELGTRAVMFDYDTSSLPPYTDYSPSGSTELVLPSASPSNQLMSACGCNTNLKFEMLGFIDGQPIFSTAEEAEQYGQDEMGCTGHHKHTDEDGNEVYMSCETHPVDSDDYGIDEYSKEEVEGLILLGQLRETNYEEFERLIPQLVEGVTREELTALNFKTPQKYYQYVRVDSGEPTRDFCDSIENYYFRRFAIDAMKSYNLEFGHNRQPYSKWIYKGGPNCIHAWKEVVVVGKKITDNGLVPGNPGIPPKQMPNNGYYSKETKRKSEVAYIISQQNMSEIKQEIFKKDLEKRMIFTPLMIPNILIPRLDDVTKEKYYVRFKPDVIEKIRNKFMTEQRLRETNLEHSDKKFKDLVMVESWIVESDQDKVYSLGFTKEQVPYGTWMAGYKVLETEEGNQIWEELIKPGVVRGASVEGNFILNFTRIENDQYLLDKINQIINSII